MPTIIELAVREMRMTAAEALWAATAGGARALRRTDIGTLAPGNRAEATVLEAPSHHHLAYRPGTPIACALDLGGGR
jgi:imidazolonepropionase